MNHFKLQHSCDLPPLPKPPLTFLNSHSSIRLPSPACTGETARVGAADQGAQAGQPTAVHPANRHQGHGAARRAR